MYTEHTSEQTIVLFNFLWLRIGGCRGGRGKLRFGFAFAARASRLPPKGLFRALLLVRFAVILSTDGQRATCNGRRAGLTVRLPASVAVSQRGKVSRCARTRRVRHCKRMPLRLARKPAAAFLMAWRYKLTVERKKSLRRRFGAF